MRTHDIAILGQERPGHNSVHAFTHGNGGDIARRLPNGDKPGTSQKASHRGRCEIRDSAVAQLHELFEPITTKEEVLKVLECLPGKGRPRQLTRAAESGINLGGRQCDRGGRSRRT